VKYSDPGDVPAALRLSNTVFIDRAIIITLYHGSRLIVYSVFIVVCANIFCNFLVVLDHFQDELPDEVKEIEISISSSGFGSSDPKLPATLTNQVWTKVYFISKVNANIKKYLFLMLIIKLVQQTKYNGVAQKKIDEAVNCAQQLMPVALPQEDMPGI
jgi:hypothetical protein